MIRILKIASVFIAAAYLILALCFNEWNWFHYWSFQLTPRSVIGNGFLFILLCSVIAAISED